ncbi:MAG: uracil-DNA glycosylase, partial [Spirochaetaceae bacterium]
TTAVPGMGVLDPLVMIIGEGPGGEEDRKGLPFVGRAGQYLDKWLHAIGLSRERDVYITNIVKCRPPGNRDPQTAEIDACTPYLGRQIDIVRPRSILALGRFAGSRLSGRMDSLGKMRGRTFDFKGVPVVVTYHPSGVLRNPEYRRPVWDDLRRLREIYTGAETAGRDGADSAGRDGADSAGRDGADTGEA